MVHLTLSLLETEIQRLEEKPAELHDCLPMKAHKFISGTMFLELNMKQFIWKVPVIFDHSLLKTQSSHGCTVIWPPVDAGLTSHSTAPGPKGTWMCPSPGSLPGPFTTTTFFVSQPNPAHRTLKTEPSGHLLQQLLGEGHQKKTLTILSILRDNSTNKTRAPWRNGNPGS